MTFEAGVILAVPVTAFLMYLINDWFSAKDFDSMPNILKNVSFWVKHFFQVMIVAMLPTTFTVINTVSRECGYGGSFDWLVSWAWSLFFIFFTFYTISIIVYFVTSLSKGGRPHG